MNLFLVKKIPHFNLSLAKFFAIFLVCFLIVINTNQISANQAYIPESTPIERPQSMIGAQVQLPGNGITVGGGFSENTFANLGLGPEWSNVTSMNTFDVKFPNNNAVYHIVTVTGQGQFFDDSPRRYTYEVNPADGSEKLVPNFTTFPKDSTELTLNPKLLNDQNGPLIYDYREGKYIYTDANGVSHNLDPVNIDAQVKALMAQNPKDTKLAESVNATKAGAYRNSTDTAARIAETGNTDPKAPRGELDCGSNIPCMLTQAIYYITIKPASWLLIASGFFLDFTMTKTIVEFKKTISNGGNEKSFYSVILLVWGIFRDIINMSFIFLLLYASIKTILKADTSGLKKTIGSIIVVALLINFSLFFVEVIIDFSNNTAVTIYNAITQNEGRQNNLAEVFMKNLSLETLFTAAKDLSNTRGTNFTTMITICIFGSVFILILAVVFFVLAVLFAVRFIQFIILMMMAPIGFATYALPKLNEAFDGSFWKNLFEQAFFAPLMIFFLWISIKLLYAINALGGSGANLKTMMTNGKAMGGNPESGLGGIGAYILGYFVLIFMLIKGMETAKKMSSSGAKGLQSGLLKWSGANRVEKYLAPKYVAGGIARQTLGRGATRFADSATMRGMQSTAIGRFIKDKSLAVGKAGFGEKTGFSQNEAERVKRLETAKNDLEKKTYAERLKINEHEQRVFEAEVPQNALRTHINTTDALEHAKRQVDLGTKEKEAKQEVFDAKDAPTLKQAQTKLQNIQGEIRDTNKALLTSFQKIGIKLVDTTPESIKKANDEAKEVQNKVVKENPNIDFQKNQTELKEILEKIESHTDDEKNELKKVKDAIELESKSRVTKFTTNLVTGGIGNLGIPSRASKEVNMRLMSERRKTPEEKKADADNSKMKKMFQNAFKEELKTPKAPEEKPKE